MSESDFLRQLEVIISANHNKPVKIDPETNLLDSGLVNSTGMIEVILLAEELSGKTIDAESLEPELFENGRKLYQAFFSERR